MSQAKVKTYAPSEPTFCTKVTTFLYPTSAECCEAPDSVASTPALRRSWIWYLLRVSGVLFLAATVLESIHVVTGGEYKQTKYGESFPLFSILGYGSGPVSAVSAFLAAVFLVAKSQDLIKSAEMMDSLLTVFKEFLPPHFQLSVRHRFKTYITLLEFFIALRFAVGLFDPFVIQPNFFEWKFYTWIPASIGVISVYRETLLLLAMSLMGSTILIFTLFCVLLDMCMVAFAAENRHFLKQVECENNDEVCRKNGQFEDDYISRLKLLRIHHEKINDLYDQIQRTFGIKMLADVMVIMLNLLSNIAWFAMWSVNEEFLNWQTISWHFLSLLVYGGIAGCLVGRPFFFELKFKRMVEGIERVLYRKQQITKDPRIEEISLTFALRRRLQFKVLCFSAGGVIDIHHMVISLAAVIAGFLVFVTQRISMYNEMSRHRGATVCLSGMIINGTCSM